MTALYGPLRSWKIKKLVMPGKILKRRRKLAQSEPPILNSLEMEASCSQDIKNHKTQKTLRILHFIFRHDISKLL
jgi:hypothetical protein